MKHRVLLGLTVTIGIVACSSNTTSLGGPEGSQASASSAVEDAGPKPQSSVEPTAPSDGGSDADAGCRTWWLGYTWGPIPTENPCEYFLPTPPLDSWGNPALDPTTWDPSNVYVEIIERHEPYGAYKESIEGCGGDSSDGWYYVPPADGGLPTRFMICPRICGHLSPHLSFRITSWYDVCVP
jgi:hypothetical protein